MLWMKLWKMKENGDVSSTPEILMPQVKNTAQKIRIDTLTGTILINMNGL